MQDKEFDDHIRKMLEDYTPEEYNPADWDSLEDRLHELNAQAPSPEVVEPVAKGLGWSAGKLAAAASFLVLTVLNAVLFLKRPDAEKQQAETQQPVISAQQLPQTTIRSNSETAERTASASERNLSSAAEAQVEALLTAEEIAAAPEKLQSSVASLQQTATGASANKLVTPLNAPATGNRGTMAQAAGSRKQAPAGNGAAHTQPQLPLYTSGGHQPIMNHAGFTSGGYAGRETAITSAECANNARPEIPYIIVGEDTITNFKLMVQACDVLNFRIVSRDQDSRDKLTLTTNLAQVLPGAVLQSNNANRPTAIFSWSPTAAFIKPDPHYFNVTVTDGKCENSARTYRFEITVVSPFMVQLTGDQHILQGESSHLSIEGAGSDVKYSWFPDNGTLSSLSSRTIVARPTETTTYYVRMTNASGCVVTDSITVNVKATPKEIVEEKMVFPNILTPNNDGKNDYFEVKELSAGTYNLEIYDRMGKTVYSMKGYDNKWDARGLADGVYYYMISVPATNKVYKGWIEVLR